jgi:multidrug resistance efflux pump
MFIRYFFRVLATVLIAVAAFAIGHRLWNNYMNSPWTRDGRVRAYVVSIAPDVSGAVTALPVHDNQWVKRGEVLMQIDLAHYEVALAQADAAVAAKKAAWAMRRADAGRRADMSNLVVSTEQRENASLEAQAAFADYQAALAQQAAAALNLARTTVRAPIDGYVTNLQVQAGDYANAGVARLAVIDSQSFWVYGYFEETKLPEIRIGAPVRIELMSGERLSGRVESVARGIYDRDNPQSRELTADVNPTFNWVRLAQRVPVRIRLDPVPANVVLAAGQTCTVIVEPEAPAPAHAPSPAHASAAPPVAASASVGRSAAASAP